jgi:hypothetical protein
VAKARAPIQSVQYQSLHGGIVPQEPLERSGGAGTSISRVGSGVALPRSPELHQRWTVGTEFQNAFHFGEVNDDRDALALGIRFLLALRRVPNTRSRSASSVAMRARPWN